MPDTPISLRERLRLRPDPASWQRLVDLYAPWIRQSFLRYDLQLSDVDDLVQDVFGVLLRELPQFRHDLRRGAFRRWLRGITVNRLRYYRGNLRPPTLTACDVDSLLDQLEDPDSNLSRLWDLEHDQHFARRLLELLEPEFEPNIRCAFEMQVSQSKPAADVAAELGMSANAVRIAKSRDMSRFRQEIEGLVDE